jgi:hypothetical protein
MVAPALRCYFSGLTGPPNGALRCSVTKKMTSKYGDYTNDAEFQKPWYKRMF